MVFSIIFDKTINFFDRSDQNINLPMNSRIENIVTKLGIDSQIFGKISDLGNQNSLPCKICFDKNKLSYEKKKLTDYIDTIVRESYGK